jgi:hypothetical protein
MGITIESAGGSDMRKVGSCVLESRSGSQPWTQMTRYANGMRRGGANPALVRRYRLVSGARGFPSKLEFRGQSASRPLGKFMDETGGLIEDDKPLRHSLSRKRPSRYGDLSLPFVVAINEDPFLFGDDEFHRMNVLFGHLAVEIDRGSRETRSVRMPDGFWRGPGALPRNRRLAAVLFTSHLAPWTLDRTQLELWDNPFANPPVPEAAIPDVVHRCQLVIDDEGPASSHDCRQPALPPRFWASEESPGLTMSRSP